MKRFIIRIVAVICVLTMSACCSFKASVHKDSETNVKLSEAQIFLKGAEEYKQSYPDEFRRAGEKLNEAMLQMKKCNKDEAFSNAEESIELSDQILKKSAEGNVKEAEKQAEKFVEIVKHFPESPVKDLIPKYNKMIEHLKAMTRKIERLSLSDIRQLGTYKEDLDEHDKIGFEVIDSDISFNPGKYKINELSRAGREKLENEVKKILRWDSSDKKKKMIVRIKTKGYTDAVPFQTPDLIRELENGPTTVPRNPGDNRRKALNMNLSYFRAETIATYIKQRLEAKDNSITVRIEFVGYGETLPPGIASPYPPDNPRRRICIIYSYPDFSEKSEK